MARLSSLIVIISALSLVPPAAAAQTKRGFVWYDRVGSCTGSHPPVFQANPLGVPFNLQAYRIFVGTVPPSRTGLIDISVRLQHSNGEAIDFVAAARHANVAGIADVSAWRAFVSPWVFGPAEGLVVAVSCVVVGQAANGFGPRDTEAPPEQWHVLIQVEGYE